MANGLTLKGALTKKSECIKGLKGLKENLKGLRAKSKPYKLRGGIVLITFKILRLSNFEFMLIQNEHGF